MNDNDAKVHDLQDLSLRWDHAQQAWKEATDVYSQLASEQERLTAEQARVKAELQTQIERVNEAFEAASRAAADYGAALVVELKRRGLPVPQELNQVAAAKVDDDGEDDARAVERLPWGTSTKIVDAACALLRETKESTLQDIVQFVQEQLGLAIPPSTIRSAIHRSERIIRIGRGMYSLRSDIVG